MISFKNLLIITIIILASFKICFAAEDSDFEYWNTESLSLKISDGLSIKLEEEFRLRENGGNLYYQHSDLGFSYSGLADWLDLGTNYRQVFEKKNGEWKEENRPHLNATLKWKLFDCNMSNRARFEYRNAEDSENYWRYRNKLILKLPIKFTKFGIQPYLAEEILYDFNDETLNGNRFYAGLSFELINNLKADMFYLWQTSESDHEWSDINVFGTKFNFSF